jgi:lactate racemase
MSEAELRTAAWYGDRPLTLAFPEDWRLRILAPQTPPPLPEEEIAEALERPVGQPPIRELARGRSRPLVVIDDLTRPTPAECVLPAVLRQLAEAGIPSGSVSILIASGAHGPAERGAMEKKVGPQAARSCRLLAHDHKGDLLRVGRTSFGTPVIVNREVSNSDFVLGIGGIYPQHSTGFGGGSKLAMGVLGTRSISALHYRHKSMAGSYETDNDFRRDLDQVARLIGLEVTISMQIDANREPIRVVSGDPARYYDEEVAFAKRAYRAPPPGAADLVISNAYPIDVSLTFMRSKGVIPLLYAAPHASRIIVSACPEGIGHHALFPFMDPPRLFRQRHIARVAVNAPGALPGKVAGRVARRIRRGRSQNGGPVGETTRRSPIWLHPPGRPDASLPREIPGMRAVYSWHEALAKVHEEQGRRQELNVVIYACAPLQVIGRPPQVEAGLSSELAALE